MPGEKVLLIDSSAAVQSIGQTALEEAGFHVITGSNGVSALTAPEIKEMDVLLLDINTEGVDGFLATRELKTSPDTYQIPIVLLIPQEEVETRASQSLRGANGYLAKPFEPAAVVAQVEAAIQERTVKERARQYLRDAADQFMQDLADQHIRDAVENKTQIIVERAIQNVITELDQRIGQEVNSRMTTLTSEREQELVRATVHEVAQSMVEKLAERKVTEAIEQLLSEMTEGAVKKVADSVIPTISRKHLKDSMEHVLPREISQQVQKAMENLVPDVSKKIVMTIDGIAQKVVPKAAREKLPEMTERHVKATTDKVLPDQVRTLVGQELVHQINDHVAPAIRDSATRLNRRIMVMAVIQWAVIVGGMIALFAWHWMLTR